MARKPLPPKAPQRKRAMLTSLTDIGNALRQTAGTSPADAIKQAQAMLKPSPQRLGGQAVRHAAMEAAHHAAQATPRRKLPSIEEAPTPPPTAPVPTKALITDPFDLIWPYDNMKPGAQRGRVLLTGWVDLADLLKWAPYWQPRFGTTIKIICEKRRAEDGGLFIIEIANHTIDENISEVPLNQPWNAVRMKMLADEKARGAHIETFPLKKDTPATESANKPAPVPAPTKAATTAVTTPKARKRLGGDLGAWSDVIVDNRAKPTPTRIVTARSPKDIAKARRVVTNGNDSRRT